MKAHIYKSKHYEPYPWIAEIDYTDENGARDTSLDSVDYGNFATREEAFDFAHQVFEKGEAL